MTDIPMPLETDSKYYENNKFNEKLYMKEYLEWEAINDAALAEQRMKRQQEEELEYARQESMRKIASVPVVQQKQYVPTPPTYRSKAKISDKQSRITSFLTSQQQMDKIDELNTIDKSFTQSVGDVEKIKIHCDYKEKVQLTSAEEKKVDMMKDTISAREKQISVSEAKIERLVSQITTTEQLHQAQVTSLEDKYQAQVRALEEKFRADMERLKMNYETQLKATENKHNVTVTKLEDEKIKSERYVADTQVELNKLVNKLDEKIRPKVRLTMSDYTKLRTIKSTKLEKQLTDINKWYDYLKGMDEALEIELEAYHGTEIHKIDEDDLEGVVWLRDKYDYETLYMRVKHKIQKQLNIVNELLDCSEATE